MQTFLYLLGDSQSDSLTVNHMYAKLILVHLLLWRAVLVICPLPPPPRGYHRSINPWTAGVEAGLLHSLTEHPPFIPPLNSSFSLPVPSSAITSHHWVSCVKRHGSLPPLSCLSWIKVWHTCGLSKEVGMHCGRGDWFPRSLWYWKLDHFLHEWPL